MQPGKSDQRPLRFNDHLSRVVVGIGDIGSDTVVLTEWAGREPGLQAVTVTCAEDLRAVRRSIDCRSPRKESQNGVAPSALKLQTERRISGIRIVL